MLDAPVLSVDTNGMTSLDTLLAQNPEWSPVLAAYAAAEPLLPPAPKRAEPAAEAQTEAVEDGRWVPRLHDVQGIEADRLPRIHGRLIAEGLLKFNLLGRSAGIGYRLTPTGRHALGLAPQGDTDERSERVTEEQEPAAA
jgi:hypothetical protein